MGFSDKSRKIAGLVAWLFIIIGVVCLVLGIVSLVTQRTLEELWSGYRIMAPYTGRLLEGWKGTFLIGMILGASAMLTGIFLRYAVKKGKRRTPKPPDAKD